MHRSIRIGVIAVGILIVIGLILPRLVNVNSFRPKLESELTSVLGREVKVGNLSLSVFSGTVSADNISIADDPAFSKEPFVTAKSFKASVEVKPLIFSKTLHITGITLDEPQITLLQGAGGRWNFSTLGGSSTTPPAKSAEATGNALSVDKLNVEQGRLLVGTANSAKKPEVYDKVKIEVTGFSPAAQFPFSLTAGLPGGGDLNLKGKCGPLNPGSTGETPFQASIIVRKLNLAASGFVSPSTGIQGLADFDGVLNSDGQRAKANGTLKADNLKLAEKGAPCKRTVTVTCALDHNLKAETGALTQGDLAIGKAVAHLTGSYQTQEQQETLSMKIRGSEMPLDDLEAALPAVGVVLPANSKLQGGALSLDLAISGPTDKPVITGSIRLSNAKLAGFDLGSKLSAIPALSGKQSGGKDTTIQNCSTTVRMGPEGTQANAINLTIPSLGVVTGAGTISPSGALNFDMNVNLSGGSEGGVIQRTGVGGNGGVPFEIQGTTSDPKFVPNVKAIAGSAAKQAISGKVSGTEVAGKLGRRRR